MDYRGIWFNKDNVWRFETTFQQLDQKDITPNSIISSNPQNNNRQQTSTSPFSLSPNDLPCLILWLAPRQTSHRFIKTNVITKCKQNNKRCNSTSTSRTCCKSTHGEISEINNLRYRTFLSSFNLLRRWRLINY